MSQERAETRPAGPIPDAAFSWTYGAEALFFIGIAFALMRWVRRTLVDIGGTSARPPTKREQQVLMTVDNAAARHLIARGLISTEALTAMSDRERAMLLSATARQLESVPASAGPASPPRVAEHDAHARITVYCPLCGRPVTPLPQPIPFVATCNACNKRVQVRGDGPDRISIVVSEPNT